MVAGQPIERSRWGQPVRVVPGPVKVLLTVGANKVERTLVAAAGQKHEMKIGPAQPIAPVTAPPTAEAGASFVWPGPDRKLIAYISGGVGAAGMLTFGVFGTLSAGQAGRLEDACPDPARCDPELEDFASRGSAYQTAANTGLIIGLVGIGAGAGFYVWDMLDEGGDAVTASTRPKIQVGPGSLVVSGRF